MPGNYDRGGSGRGGGRRGGGPQQPPLPKPYEFVPLPKQKPDIQEPIGHHQYHAERWSGRLTGTIVALSPVHVASGLLVEKDDKDYPLVKAHFRTQEKLAIPSTSLKGCIRSIVEAITRSSLGVTRARGVPRDYMPSRMPDKLDVAQRMFGAMGYQGRIRFKDAVLESGGAKIVPSLQLYRPRPESVKTYFDGGTPRGRKFYMHGTVAEGNLPLETCDVNSEFQLHVDFDNLTDSEVGVLLIALGLGEPRIWPKLGGAKPTCLGTIEVANPRLEVVETNEVAYTTFDLNLVERDVEEMVTAAQTEKLVQREQWEKLAGTLHWPRPDRACPDRNY